MKKWLPYLFPFVVTLVVGVISLTHVPFDSFDETNTIRIIGQSFSAIVSILDHESNFPLFYFILKIVYNVFQNNQLLLQVIYYLSYLCSGMVFYKITTYFSPNKGKNLTALGIFYSIPALIYHASYIRMYNAAILLSLVLLLCIVKYVHEKRQTFLYFAAFLLTIIAILHPLGVIAAVLFLPLLTTREIERKQKVLVVIAIILAAVGYILQLIIKQHAVETYAVTGAKYIESLNITVASAGLFFHFAAAVLKPRNAIYLVAFPIFVFIVSDVVLLYSSLIKKQVTFLDKIAFTSFAIFFLIPPLLGTKIYLHHLHYFLGFGIFGITYVFLKYKEKLIEISKLKRVILALFLIVISVLLVYLNKTIIVSVYATNENNTNVMLLVGTVLALVYVYLPKAEKTLAIVIPMILVVCTVIFYYFIPITVNSKRCQYFQHLVETKQMYFFIQHNEANLYFNCLQSNEHIVLMDEHRQLFFAGKHSNYEILIEQSKRGGSYASFDEIQQVFNSDTSLIEYNYIQNMSVLVLGSRYCKMEQDAMHLQIKGFRFSTCGRYNEYIYERSQ